MMNTFTKLTSLALVALVTQSGYAFNQAAVDYVKQHKKFNESLCKQINDYDSYETCMKPHRDLSGANLSGVDLSDTDLSSANLSNTNLQGAILMRANLGYPNVSGANLSGANLSGADLRGAVARVIFTTSGPGGSVTTATGDQIITKEWLKSQGAIIDEKTQITGNR